MYQIGYLITQCFCQDLETSQHFATLYCDIWYDSDHYIIGGVLEYVKNQDIMQTKISKYPEI